MNYEVKDFNNLKELKKFDKKLVKRLLEYVDSNETEWQEDYLYFYPTLEDYAKYEVFEGWYADLVGGMDNTNGAPKLSLYLDFKTLGVDLAKSWDDSCHYYDEETGCVITTSYGW